MAFGTTMLLALLLGFLILGPKQMHAVLGRVAQAKTQFDRAVHIFKAQLTLDQEPSPSDDETPLDPPTDHRKLEP
jgi:Sec-independent protein translocase protein TatA